MADFSDIPKGVARKIAADHLDDLEDLESFRLVCSFWRSESKGVDYTNFRPSKNTQLPWLMLADSPTHSYRRFYSLSKHMFLKIDLPRFDDDHRRYFSSKGWLIGVSRKQAFITFFDPFSGDIVKPPNVPIRDFWGGDGWDDEFYLYQFSKFIFSSSRRASSCEDFQVAMIFNAHKHIAFWRPGQQCWIEPVTDFKVRQIEDVCFFRGIFYSIDHYSQVIAFGKKPRIVVNLASQPQGLMSDVPCKYYIVVLGSTLLVIHREVELDDDKMYWTESFLLFEVNVDNGKARQVKDIGNRALFVGHNSTFFVEASPQSQSCKSGCRPNCIYFTDDNAEWYFPQNPPHHGGGGGIDMGIYSLEENKVVDRLYEGPSQFSYETPPLWVELPHY